MTPQRRATLIERFDRYFVMSSLNATADRTAQQVLFERFEHWDDIQIAVAVLGALAANDWVETLPDQTAEETRAYRDLFGATSWSAFNKGTHMLTILQNDDRISLRPLERKGRGWLNRFAEDEVLQAPEPSELGPALHQALISDR